MTYYPVKISRIIKHLSSQDALLIQNKFILKRDFYRRVRLRFPRFSSSSDSLFEPFMSYPHP